MKILKPYFYDEFECIGNKCVDSCCIGWKICIDKRTYSMYKKVTGEFGEKLRNNISRSRKDNTLLSYGKMKLDGNSRCKFLDKNNLCEVYINLGPEHMCNTCKKYPRLINKYGDIYEKSLTLSCPTVAEFLVKNNEPLGFVLNEENLTSLDRENLKKDENYNKKLYNLLWESRSFAIEIAQFREIPIWKRLVFINLLGEKIQSLIKNNEYDNYNSIFDVLRKSIIDDEMQKSLENIPTLNNIKVLFSNAIIEYRIKNKISNDKFNSLIYLYDEFVTKEINLLDKEDKEKIFDVIRERELEFDEYFGEREYVLENYIVYNLYNNFMNALSTKDLHREIIRLTISYTVIKKLIVGQWINRGKEILEEDLINNLYSFSRTMEHNEGFIKSIYYKIKNAGYDTLAYLTILVR